MLSPPRAFSANLGKLEGEQRSQQVVGNTRLCHRLVTNLIRGTAPADKNGNQQRS